MKESESSLTDHIVFCVCHASEPQNKLCHQFILHKKTHFLVSSPNQQRLMTIEDKKI